jgi:hypothetical protein
LAQFVSFKIDDDEEVTEGIFRAFIAAKVSLSIMTAKNMPKTVSILVYEVLILFQVFVEEVIEHSCDLLRKHLDGLLAVLDISMDKLGPKIGFIHRYLLCLFLISSLEAEVAGKRRSSTAGKKKASDLPRMFLNISTELISIMEFLPTLITIQSLPDTLILQVTWALPVNSQS